MCVYLCVEAESFSFMGCSSGRNSSIQVTCSEHEGEREKDRFRVATTLSGMPGNVGQHHGHLYVTHLAVGVLTAFFSLHRSIHVTQKIPVVCVLGMILAVQLKHAHVALPVSGPHKAKS